MFYEQQTWYRRTKGLEQVCSTNEKSPEQKTAKFFSMLAFSLFRQNRGDENISVLLKGLLHFHHRTWAKGHLTNKLFWDSQRSEHLYQELQPQVQRWSNFLALKFPRTWNIINSGLQFQKNLHQEIVLKTFYKKIYMKLLTAQCLLIG